ncbi:uncharacterized protein LOC143452275 [Clavelina lepadiformis]|uniref:uncharacterized protein LOC143452275 n=1 Tax=Clavelina lepadiformis TaxID=159417 RepID=UPI0040431EFD
MLTINQVLNRVRDELQIPVEPIKVCIKPAKVSDKMLTDKIQHRLEKKKQRYPQISFDFFNFIGGFEIGRYTGIQLLHFMLSLLCDEHVRRNGNCILFNVNQEKAFAILVYVDDKTLEMVVSSDKSSPIGHLFPKLYDDKTCEKFPNDIQEAKSLRSELSQKFENFMGKKFSETVLCPFSSAFLGVFLDICRAYFYVNPYRKKQKQLFKALLPACVKLAIDSQQSGKLQDVLHYQNLETEKDIILGSIKHDADESFAEIDIQKTIEALKSFYEIPFHSQLSETSTS